MKQTIQVERTSKKSKRSTHRWLFFFCIWLVGRLGTIEVLAAPTYPTPTSSFYVLDGADVLSDKTEATIIDTGVRFEQTRSQPQIVVITVESLEGMSVEEYAVEVFEQWGIGQEKEDNGVLVLFAKQERKIKIEVGYGLEGRIPDGKAGRILDDHLGALQDDAFDEGLAGIYDDLVEEVKAEYFIEVDSDQNFVEPSSSQIDQLKQEQAARTKKIIYAGLVLLGLGIVWLFVALRKWNKRQEARRIEARRQLEKEATAFYAKHHGGAHADIEEMIAYKRRIDLERQRKEKEEKDRNRAMRALEKTHPRGSITEQMIQAYLVKEAFELRRRQEAERIRNQDQGPFGGSGGSFGGGGSSGGGGASRGF